MSCVPQLSGLNIHSRCHSVTTLYIIYPLQMSTLSEPFVHQQACACYHSDAEFGRQYKAGCNPGVLTVPGTLPSGCAITGADVDGAVSSRCGPQTSCILKQSAMVR